MSRTALLDIFQSFFLVAAVACCVADRDWYRHRLADALERRGQHDFHGEFGPIVWWRPWRFAAGVMFGAALACKWNSVFVLAVFGVLSVLWDVGAHEARRRQLAIVAGGAGRRHSGVRAHGRGGRRGIPCRPGFSSCWAPEVTTATGVGQPPLGEGLRRGFASLLYFLKRSTVSHTATTSTRPRTPTSAHPLGWLAMVRPTDFDAMNDIKPGTDGCVGPENCIRVISAMGTPVLWWMAAIALVVCAVWWIGGRDWRFGVPVLGALSTYLPWFNYTDRPLFFFYSITIIPFTVIGLALVMGLILGPANSPGRRRGAMIVGVSDRAGRAELRLHLPRAHRPAVALFGVVVTHVVAVVDLTPMGR